MTKRKVGAVRRAEQPAVDGAAAEPSGTGADAVPGPDAVPGSDGSSGGEPRVTLAKGSAVPDAGFTVPGVATGEPRRQHLPGGPLDIAITLIISMVACFAFQKQLMEILQRPIHQVMKDTAAEQLKDPPIPVNPDRWEAAKAVFRAFAWRANDCRFVA